MLRIIAILLLLTIPAFAQQSSVSERMLQGIIGQLVVQNAKLTEQVQQLTEENAELKKAKPDAQHK